MLTSLAGAADSQLERIARLLRPFRSQEAVRLGWRGGHPGLTVIKHDLRAWVESRIVRLAPGSDERALAATLNRELRQAGLFCESEQKDFNCLEKLGFLGQVELRWRGPFLMAKTGVSILCGLDESAYLYRRGQTGWERIWESEENDYAEDKYRPRRIKSVLVSQSQGEFDRLVLSLGASEGCYSVWHGIYYRLHRVTLNEKPQTLLDEAEAGNVGSEPPVWGRVTADSALVVYSTYSVDPSRVTRKTVRHYRIAGKQVLRTDPVALSPIEFVDEWLGCSWAESAKWTEPNSAQPPRAAYEAVQHRVVGGEFNGYPRHCKDHPDLWQVEYKPYDDGSSTYFLVRWRPPLTFRMVAAAAEPWGDCTEADPEAYEGSDLLVVGTRGQ